MTYFNVELQWKQRKKEVCF